MGEVARNSLKGYTYQQSVFILFLGLMDTERTIGKIIVEALDTKNFDDIYLKDVIIDTCKKESYRIQVKNYPNVSDESIKIDNNVLNINGNKNSFDEADNNVLVVNSALIETDDEFMGFPCVRKENITIIPLTPKKIADKLDNMFNTEARELQIMHLADEITEDAVFEIDIEKLPDIINMSTDLEDQTILLRTVPDEFLQDITFIEGKPGVGKSHFVNEICDKYPEAIVYRFWIGSQDPNRNRRILFENFISEIGIKVYKTAKKVIIDELIDTIRDQNKLIIIDGLDHVENYNPRQLQEFIDFINKLVDVRVVVLSRPLKCNIEWKKSNLLDWSYDETRLYLEVAHNITEYKVQNQIYKITNGYPIITYFMYFNHRDHSVDAIDTALIVFEKEGFIQEDESAKIISEFMQRSDDGISQLITSYSNKKGKSYIEKLYRKGYFSDSDYKIRFWELNPESYGCFSKQEMRKQITDLLNAHSYGKTIEGRDLRTVMNSVYKNMVLDGIEYCGYSILSPDDKYIPELEARGITYYASEEKTDKEYLPFEHGYINEDDLQYIIEHKIGFNEISKYTDGWYSCLPFVYFYAIYDRKDIQNNYLEILHNSLYARASGKEFLGNWNLVLGNIPEFLFTYEIDVDWEMLYTVFTEFLNISLLRL